MKTSLRPVELSSRRPVSGITAALSAFIALLAVLTGLVLVPLIVFPGTRPLPDAPGAIAASQTQPYESSQETELARQRSAVLQAQLSERARTAASVLNYSAQDEMELAGVRYAILRDAKRNLFDSSLR